jgi:hypothetical protein
VLPGRWRTAHQVLAKCLPTLLLPQLTPPARVQAMHARKLLAPNPRDRDAATLWDRTFSVAQEVSPHLTPERVLGAG